MPLLAVELAVARQQRATERGSLEALNRKKGLFSEKIGEFARKKKCHRGLTEGLRGRKQNTQRKNRNRQALRTPSL